MMHLLNSEHREDKEKFKLSQVTEIIDFYISMLRYYLYECWSKTQSLLPCHDTTPALDTDLTTILPSRHTSSIARGPF